VAAAQGRPLETQGPGRGEQPHRSHSHSHRRSRSHRRSHKHSCRCLPLPECPLGRPLPPTPGTGARRRTQATRTINTATAAPLPFPLQTVQRRLFPGLAPQTRGPAGASLRPGVEVMGGLGTAGRCCQGGGGGWGVPRAQSTGRTRWGPNAYEYSTGDDHSSSSSFTGLADPPSPRPSPSSSPCSSECLSVSTVHYSVYLDYCTVQGTVWYLDHCYSAPEFCVLLWYNSNALTSLIIHVAVPARHGSVPLTQSRLRWSPAGAPSALGPRYARAAGSSARSWWGCSWRWSWRWRWGWASGLPLPGQQQHPPRRLS